MNQIEHGEDDGGDHVARNQYLTKTYEKSKCQLEYDCQKSIILKAINSFVLNIPCKCFVNLNMFVKVSVCQCTFRRAR